MSRSFKIIISILGALLMFLVLFAIATNSPELLAIAFIYAAVPVGIIAFLSRQPRRAVLRRRAAVVLSYAEQAIRMNLPLPQFLAAAEASEPFGTARRLRAVRLELEAGTSISDALQRGVRFMPPRTLALVAAGERAGRLGKTLERLVKEQQSAAWRDPVEDLYLSIYPLCMIVGVIGVVSLIMVFIMPKFMQIFKDFKAPVPALTRWAVTLYWDFSLGGWILVPVALAALMWLVPDLFYSLWRSLGWMPGGLSADRNWADVCRVIADSLDASLPMDAALRAAGELSIGKGIGRKLNQWAAGIESGMSSADAARGAGVPPLIVGLTGVSEVTAAREAFVFLARYYHSRFSRLRQLIRGAAVPAMVLFFGVMVGIVALSVFLPIISLVEIASPYRGAL